MLAVRMATSAMDPRTTASEAAHLARANAATHAQRAHCHELVVQGIAVHTACEERASRAQLSTTFKNVFDSPSVWAALIAPARIDHDARVVETLPRPDEVFPPIAWAQIRLHKTFRTEAWTVCISNPPTLPLDGAQLRYIVERTRDDVSVTSMAADSLVLNRLVQAGMSLQDAKDHLLDRRRRATLQRQRTFFCELVQIGHLRACGIKTYVSRPASVLWSAAVFGLYTAVLIGILASARHACAVGIGFSGLGIIGNFCTTFCMLFTPLSLVLLSLDVLETGRRHEMADNLYRQIYGPLRATPKC